VPHAPADLLVCVIAALTGAWRLDGLAVDNAGRRNNFALLAHPIKHQRKIVDRSEKEASNNAPEPVVHRLVRGENRVATCSIRSRNAPDNEVH
jgi:hypothetical protein